MAQEKSMPKVSAVIMAAGFSQRFGKNKLLTLVKGAPLFTRSICAASGANLTGFVVVTQYREIMEYCKKHDIPVIENTAPQRGQSYSVQLGTKYFSQKHHLLFLTADQPNITTEVIDTLIAMAQEHPQALLRSQSDGAPASPTLFPPSLRGELLALQGDNGGREIFQRHPSRVLSVPFAPYLLQDIDTIEDLKNLIL